MDSPPCPCCSTSAVIAQLLFGVFTVLLSLWYLMSKFDKDTAPILRWIFKSILVLNLIVCAIVLVLACSESNRQLLFSKIFSAIGNPKKPDPVRCDFLSELHGRVLEIGPGPGTNFKCMQNNTRITEWVGVEPNAYFISDQLEMKSEFGIVFPTRNLNVSGGDELDIEPGGFDYVIGTHLLCSVDDISGVLRTIRNALKVGGVYLFFEHVRAEDGDLYLRFLQSLVAPILLLAGNGCRFKNIWSIISSSTDLSRFDISMTRFISDVPMPFIKPHIRGRAVKTQQQKA